jgi:hypothetical protein
MKPLISKVLMMLVAVTVFTPFAMAQAAPEAAPQNNAAQAADDDRLPFMHQEDEHQNPASSSESVSTGSIIFKTFGAMLIIVGLIFFGAWGLKKFGFGPKSAADNNAPELTILSTVTVGSGHGLKHQIRQSNAAGRLYAAVIYTAGRWRR